MEHESQGACASPLHPSRCETPHSQSPRFLGSVPEWLPYGTPCACLLQQVTLANGLRVILLEDPEMGLVRAFSVFSPVASSLVLTAFLPSHFCFPFLLGLHARAKVSCLSMVRHQRQRGEEKSGGLSACCGWCAVGRQVEGQLCVRGGAKLEPATQVPPPLGQLWGPLPLAPARRSF